MTLRNTLIGVGGFVLLLLLMRGIFGEGSYRILLYIGIAGGLLATVLTLSIGLGVMSFGAASQDKTTNAKWQTYMMRSRVAAQAITVLCGALLLMYTD